LGHKGPHREQPRGKGLVSTPCRYKKHLRNFQILITVGGVGKKAVVKVVITFKVAGGKVEEKGRVNSILLSVSLDRQ